ncbi:MAG TPA: TRC40/GET3/ArsA family transport-energizing ATPase [Aggregatilineales bacterium]|nr:ArsA family ATPase [Anaerolineae bacterium]HUN06089.1 TRC40/GET3/ArsA family transport-energizing ATPase [Aggregatilineales bacterium]
MRIIVHTGKGGVGKTSISAATALRCAELGLKTIVLSTDTAHSLGDSLEKEIGPEPVEIYPNLWAQEVDARYSMDKYWGLFQKYMVALFSKQGVEDVVAEEVTILPGLEEGAHLLWINKYVNENFYDVLIVDAAPTAETLRLLSLPDVTRWWFDKILSLTRGVSKVIRPISRLMRRGDSLPDDDAWGQVNELFDTLDKVRKLLTDPAMSSIRLVVNPEKMVIKETQRTYTYLNLYGYATDAILCNRIIPPEVTDPYFAMWKANQQDNIAYIGEAFGELPVMKAPLFGHEVGGLDTLRKLADALYADKNPATQMFDGQTHRIEGDSTTGFTLVVPLPFANKDDLDLYRSRDELTLRVGPYRRNIVLPYALWDLEIGDARFDQSTLRIRFVNDERQRQPAS